MEETQFLQEIQKNWKKGIEIAENLREAKMEEAQFLQEIQKNWKKGIEIAENLGGVSTGLATLWDDSQFLLRNSFSTQHWIFSSLSHKTLQCQESPFNLYVPNLIIEKQKCWNR